MKILLFVLTCAATLIVGAPLQAQEIAGPAGPRSASELETLVAPIALYPDPLIALILPASTRPSDIVLAARFLERGSDPTLAASEPWDDSVRALTRYREVIQYLDRNLEWTRNLGACFLDQPDDVMSAIQAIRARARASGLLMDSAQQEVIVEADEIRIVPAQPTVIYVPRYDPEILCVTTGPSHYYPRTFLSFGIGYGIGAWLSYDCDWRYRTVRIMHRPPTWYYQPDWRRRHDHHAGSWTRWAPRHDRSCGRNPGPAPDFSSRPRRDDSGPRAREHHRDREADRLGGQRPSSPDSDRRRRTWEHRRGQEPVDSNAVAGSAPVATAPEVIADAPPARMAPEIVATPPGRVPSPERARTDQRRFPRREDHPRFGAPDRPRREAFQPGPPVQAPGAIQAAPAVPRPSPRVERAPRSSDAPPRHHAPRNPDANVSSGSTGDSAAPSSTPPRRSDHHRESRRELN